MLRDPADTVALADPMPTDHSPITDLAPTTSASVDPSTQRRGEPIAGTSRGQRLLHLPRARSFSSPALPTDPSARFPFRAALTPASTVRRDGNPGPRKGRQTSPR